MTRLAYVSVCLLVFVVSCKSAKSKPTLAETALFTKAIEQQQLRIESDWAYPHVSNALQQVLDSRILQPDGSAGAISLVGNPNFLEISGDSITSYLPFFGERQMQVAYGGRDNTIEFKGIMEDFKSSTGKNSSYILSFKAKSNTESFSVNLTLYPNATARMRVNGNSRFPISYSGFLKSEE